MVVLKAETLTLTLTPRDVALVITLKAKTTFQTCTIPNVNPQPLRWRLTALSRLAVVIRNAALLILPSFFVPFKFSLVQMPNSDFVGMR